MYGDGSTHLRGTCPVETLGYRVEVLRNLIRLLLILPEARNDMVAMIHSIARHQKKTDHWKKGMRWRGGVHVRHVARCCVYRRGISGKEGSATVLRFLVLAFPQTRRRKRRLTTVTDVIAARNFHPTSYSLILAQVPIHPSRKV